MVRVGIIGLGHWGPNLVRVLANLPDCEVTIICDRNRARLNELQAQYPALEGTIEPDDVLTRDRVDAAIIATPTKTHYMLTRRALKNGIHAFVEKPLATNSEECRHLIELAEERHLKLFVGHVFLYSAAVAKLKDLVAGGELGDLCYIASTRLNLGPVRRDVNALWDLAPHDISIMIELMGESPHSVSCSGLAHLDENVHDVCNVTMHFGNKRMGISHVSWLDPHKKRVMTVVGDQKMAVYDDIEPLEKIKVYDIGVEALPNVDSFGEFHFSYRYGDTFSPRLAEVEPLKAECRSFIESIVHDQTPRTDGYNGLEVVRVIEAADRSLHNGGGAVALRDLASVTSEPRAQSLDSILKV